MIIKFINRNIPIFNFKPRTAKTSDSFVSSRIFSAFSIRKDFGIDLAFNF